MSANFLTANLLYFVTRNNRSEDKGFPLYRWVILPTRTPTTSSLPDPERPFASWSMNVAPDCRTSAERDSCAIRRPVGPMAANCVRREKAALSSGCKSHPANAPAGSNRSSHGGDEMAEAFGVARHI